MHSQKGQKINTMADPTVDNLKILLIEEGIAGVKTTEKKEKRLGGIYGFNLCKSLHTPDDFCRVIKQRWEKEQRNTSLRADPKKYWVHRSATVQIEYCFEVLKVAWNIRPVLASAVLRYNELVGRLANKEETT